MKHCAKKLLGLAFALALCLAVGGTAFAAQAPEFADVPAALAAQAPEFADVPAALPEQEMMDYEANVNTAEGTTTIDKLATEGYQVTIPTTVTVDSEDNTTGTLMVKAQLKQYRTLNIGIASENNWKLKYDGELAGATTPEVDYKLPQGTSNNVAADCEWEYQPEGKKLSFSTTKMQPGTSLEEDMKRVRSSSYKLPITVPTPSQATMSGTYSDKLIFTFDLVKQCVTYTINVYHQEMQLTGNHFSGADFVSKYQALKMVDKVGTNGAPIGDAQPDEVYTYEYGFANDKPVGSPPETWTRPRTGQDVPEDEDTRCWEDLTYPLNLQQNYDADNKDIVVNLNLVRKWCWLDVNGITDKSNCTDCGTDGNQEGGRIASFVNIKVFDGKNWSGWYWYSNGDDYWGTFPYGTKFQLGLHRVKDGYAYDTDDAGNVAIYANGNLEYNTSPPTTENRTTYRVYQGTLTGEPVDETLHPTSGGGNVHDGAGNKNLPRYCYNVCFVDGITYYANDGTGGREDTNLYHGPHTTFKYTDSMTLADPLSDELTGCDFTAPAGKVFAGWSTTKDYTGQTLYAPGESVSSVEWPTRPGTSNHDTLPTGDGQTECRTLYAIWKKPYTVKVQFGGAEGWTDWDEVNQSFPESKQHNDVFDSAVTLGTAYTYDNTSLTLSATENKTVWDKLQTKITQKTTDIGSYDRPEDVWQLKNEYTFTTLPANGEVTIKIKRKRYMLNVIPALMNDGGTFTVASNETEAKLYGKFKLDSCGIDQTVGEKVSYYQSMRNYGNSYRIYGVVANDGYRFVGLKRMASTGLTSANEMGTLTVKDTSIHYFGDDIHTYEGDTIYVMYERDTRNQITFDYNGGTTGGKTELVTSYDDSVYFPQVQLTHPKNLTHIGWSTVKNPGPGDEIIKLASIDPVNGVIPGHTTVSSKVKTWPNENKKVLYAVWSTSPSHAPAKKVLTVRYHANFDPNEELALDLDPNPLLDDMDEDFGFEPEPLPEDVLDPTVDAVKTVTYKPDENVVLRHCMFKRDGYVFVGWNTEPDGTGKLYRVNGAPVPDWAVGETVDLYAQWKKPEHQKAVVDSEPSVPAHPATPPERVDDGFDDAFGADPAAQPEGLDDAFGVDPADQPKALDDAFGVDPADQPKALDDAFGIDPDPQPEGLDDAFGVDPQPEALDDAFGIDPDPQPEELDDAFGV